MIDLCRVRQLSCAVVTSRNCSVEAHPTDGRSWHLWNDALTSKRIYKGSFTHTVAREIILGDSGTYFDPDVVEAFTAVESDFLEIRQRFSAGEPQMECELALST